MPYDSNDDLPDSVKNNLPEDAQTLYRKTYNNAHERYKDDAQTARVAWSAVKNSYEKNEDGKWVRKK